MSTTRSGISSCRHCFHYQVEGRRGGTCTQLGVPVQACWQACPLAAPLFASTGVSRRENVVEVPSYVSALVTNPVEAAADAGTAIAPTPIKSDRPAADVIPISAAHHHSTAHHSIADLQTYPTRHAPSALA